MMSLRLKICPNILGTWSVHGLSPLPVAKKAVTSASHFGACMRKTTKPSKTIRANKRQAKLKAKHRRQRARAAG
jgi:hypothetical protein